MEYIIPSMGGRNPAARNQEHPMADHGIKGKTIIIAGGAKNLAG